MAIRTSEPGARVALVGAGTTGGTAGAIGAIACRVFPLVLFVPGISGAWIGN